MLARLLISLLAAGWLAFSSLADDSAAALRKDLDVLRERVAALEAEAKQLRELGKAVSALGLGGEAGDPTDLPAEADARAAIESRIAKEGAGNIRLVAFRKTAGQRQQFLGQVQYFMQVELALEFRATGMWLKGFGPTPSFEFKPGIRNADSLEIIRLGSLGGLHVQRGERYDARLKLIFLKKESGWTLLE
ncbi:MAG TPA: hypothetical protein PKE47_06540 [Verrucomicrobiota bacterium]|nr:hypothetical protein [Verrucomicrobiota bacterium]